MSRQCVGADVIAKRLCDLLQSFPAAAVTGVQWQILVRKYEERYSTKVDLRSMGFDSALAAATTLLWDVLRVLDGEDIDNPVVAIEENIALTPLPGFLASWPSLYQAFHSIVQQHGTASFEDSSEGSELLMSKLKPMLQSNWHQSFNESGLCYLNEAGSGMQLKKMKHLVQAVLRWRNQYIQELSANGKRGKLHAALSPHLELAPSKKHNDMVLRSIPAADVATGFVHLDVLAVPVNQAQQTMSDLNARPDELDLLDSASIGASSSSSVELEREIASLRAENAKLRQRNEQLQVQGGMSGYGLRLPLKEAFLTNMECSVSSEHDLLDDPFEPPPQVHRQWPSSSPSTRCGSSVVDAELSCTSGATTPRSGTSGSSTPVHSFSTPLFHPGGFGSQDQVCALVPMWLDRAGIPCGIVQQARAIFDRKDQALPNFFNQY